MRMKLLKIVVVLLLSGSGNARPQKTEGSIQVQASRPNPEQWRGSGVPQTVREDSRYRWNSGSSTIPYINLHYRDNVNPSIESNVEVSVDKTRQPESTRFLRSNSNNFWNPLKFQPRNSGKIIDKQSTSMFHERSIKNDHLTRLRNTSRRQPIVPKNYSTVSGDSTKESVNCFSKTDQRFNVGYRRVQLPNSRISNLKITTRRNSTKNGPTRDFTRDSPWRKANDTLMNNSGSNVVTLSQNSKFSGQEEVFSLTVDKKVESTTAFDHVAAIRKITSMLTRNQTTSKLPLENKNGVDVGIPSTLSLHSHSNRYWNSKHSNRTKIRRPQGHPSSSNKKNQNRVHLNKMHVKRNNSSTPNTSLKNWPNSAIQNDEDFHNYDQYTTIEEDAKPEVVVEKPFPLRNSTFNYHVPVSNPNFQEIVHWLKIPAFMTNGSHIIESDQLNSPISLAFDPVYENLEPNKPSKPNIVPQLKPGFIYPLRPPSYTAEKVPIWPPSGPTRNKTQNPFVHNPQTQVSQNTVVQLINTDSSRPNRTTLGTKVPPGFIRPIASDPSSPSSSLTSSGSVSYPPFTSLASSGSGSHSPSSILSQSYPSTATTSKPGPNVHIGFTSYENNDEVPDQKPQTPVVTYDQSCPTILINTYTRINNTIQSKEGCTDLNIIINSQVFNTNAFKSTPAPLPDQSNPENYQVYGDSDKYGSQIGSDTNYQAIPIYQPSSPGSQWPQNTYYGSSKYPQNQNPQQNDVSNVEVIQDTQISISSPVEVSPPVESSLEAVEESGPLNDNTDSSAQVGSDVGQANDSPGVNSLVRPAVTPAASNPGSSVSTNISPAGLGTGSSSTPSRPSHDDDDDDDFDLSPSGIMDSIASVFTYFTFVNPLHYGFFSLAAAPFTALAAGMLGIVTFIYPWLFPASFGFSRANNNNNGDSLWYNIEQVVIQSLEKYGRMNEWKSKRKKRKR